MGLSFTFPTSYQINYGLEPLISELQAINNTLAKIQGTSPTSFTSDPPSSTGINASTIDGYGVSATPQPNTLLPLDVNGKFPPSVIPIGGNAYANPVNLSSATSDYSLSVGDVAYISFSNVSSVPLYIATTNGTYYEMHLACSNTSGNANIVYLQPNNTTYNNAVSYIEYWIGTNGSGSDAGNLNAFRVGWGVPDSTVFISNYTTLKTVRYIDISTGFGATQSHFASNIWNDTTTSWTSLGTITFPQETSGYILVRRLA